MAGSDDRVHILRTIFLDESLSIGQLAQCLRAQGKGPQAMEALESFRALLGIVARQEHTGVEGRVQAAFLAYRLCQLYEQQELSAQSQELSCFAFDLTGIERGAEAAVYVLAPRAAL